ncbi:hypothetical protein Tdes44962_MAKER09198 [Teratosphaeria destructans]|uniref:Uncharacterized protein n=1 Tax=Teratosphaeria destructans TaxID=418781 RepID=A0A9W7W393_9PEZI|nr:hypothetical protein Tdes44962_MAKER09198 [Teratosphaeria destructans]
MPPKRSKLPRAARNPPSPPPQLSKPCQAAKGSKRPLAPDAALSARPPHRAKRVKANEVAPLPLQSDPPPQRLHPETLQPLAAAGEFRLSQEEVALVLSSGSPAPVPQDEKVFVAWISVRDGFRFETVRWWRGWCLLEYEERVVGRVDDLEGVGGFGRDGRSARRVEVVANGRGTISSRIVGGDGDEGVGRGETSPGGSGLDGEAARDDASGGARDHAADEAADDAPTNAEDEEHCNDRATARPPSDLIPPTKSNPVQPFEPRELRPRNTAKPPSSSARATARTPAPARNYRTPSATRKRKRSATPGSVAAS